MPVNRLKTTYQRNMIIGLLTANLLVFTPFIILNYLVEPDEIVVINIKDTIFPNYKIEKEKNEDIQITPNIPNQYPEYTPRAGVATAWKSNIRPISSSVLSADISYTLSPLNDETWAELSSFYAEYLHMDTLGENYYYALDNAEYPITSPAKSVLKDFAYETYFNNALSERRPGINRQLYIELPKHIPNLPMLFYGEEAVLIFRITIDEKGKILEIETLHENPSDRGFASAIKSVIKTDAFIEPPLKNGQPYGCSFTFSWQHKSGKSAISVKSTDEIMVSLKRRD